MPDDQIALSQYDDAVLWSERQADLLRRLAAGERVNAEIDWANVIEEIESVGLSQVHAVQSLLTRAIEHLLKIQGWPQGSVDHWKGETVAFLTGATQRWAPSMVRVVDIGSVYADARRNVQARRFRGKPPGELPEACPFALGDLIVRRPGEPDVDALLAKLSA